MRWRGSVTTRGRCEGSRSRDYGLHSSSIELTVSHCTHSGPVSVVGIAIGYGLDGQGIESRWGRYFPHLSRPVHPASCTTGTGSFPRVKSGRGVTLTPHLLLVPWSRKSRAIPLLPLWAVRPVQCLSGCTRVHFTFTFTAHTHTHTHTHSNDLSAIYFNINLSL